MQITVTTTTTGALVELGCDATALRRLRKAAGFTQANFARMVGVSRQWYSGLERGRRNPSLRLASRIAERLQVDIAAFLFGPCVSQGNESASHDDAAGPPGSQETNAAEAFLGIGDRIEQSPNVDRCEDCGIPLSRHGLDCGTPTDDPRYVPEPLGWADSEGRIVAAPEVLP